MTQRVILCIGERKRARGVQKKKPAPEPILFHYETVYEKLNMIQLQQPSVSLTPLLNLSPNAHASSFSFYTVNSTMQIHTALWM